MSSEGSDYGGSLLKRVFSSEGRGGLTGERPLSCLAQILGSRIKQYAHVKIGRFREELGLTSNIGQVSPYSAMGPGLESRPWRVLGASTSL